jgi:hypothetical protein
MKRQWSNECLVLPWYFRRHAGANAREEEPDRSGLWRASERDRGAEPCAVFMRCAASAHAQVHNLASLQGQRAGVKEGSDQVQHHTGQEQCRNWYIMLVVGL